MQASLKLLAILMTVVGLSANAMASNMTIAYMKAQNNISFVDGEGQKLLTLTTYYPDAPASSNAYRISIVDPQSQQEIKPQFASSCYFFADDKALVNQINCTFSYGGGQTINLDRDGQATSTTPSNKINLQMIAYRTPNGMFNVMFDYWAPSIQGDRVQVNLSDLTGITTHYGYNIDGDSANCDETLSPKSNYCSRIFTEQDKFRFTCHDLGHKAKTCGCHEFLCSAPLTESGRGMDQLDEAR